MATFGTNMKLTIQHDHRAAVHALFTEVFGCAHREPMPELSLYVFDDGAFLGVYFADQGLPDDVALLAPWLEFRVDDVEGARDALGRLGVEAVPYPVDPDHSYHRVPGGPVFRIA